MAIPSCLIDSNILLRMTRRSDPQHKIVDGALARPALQGTTLHYTHQNMAEPFTENGDGFVVQHGVLGVQAHDARLAATMYVHGVGHILTLNVATFSRFSGLTVLHPASL